MAKGESGGAAVGGGTIENDSNSHFSTTNNYQARSTSSSPSWSHTHSFPSPLILPKATQRKITRISYTPCPFLGSIRTSLPATMAGIPLPTSVSTLSPSLPFILFFPVFSSTVTRSPSLFHFLHYFSLFCAERLRPFQLSVPRASCVNLSGSPTHPLRLFLSSDPCTGSIVIDR